MGAVFDKCITLSSQVVCHLTNTNEYLSTSPASPVEHLQVNSKVAGSEPDLVNLLSFNPKFIENRFQRRDAA